MKKLILFLVLIMSFLTYGQDVHFLGVDTKYTLYQPQTETQRDALTFGVNDRVIIFNSTADRFELWDGTAWVEFVGNGGGAGDNLGNHTATQDLNLNGNNLTSGDNGGLNGLNIRSDSAIQYYADYFNNGGINGHRFFFGSNNQAITFDEIAAQDRVDLRFRNSDQFYTLVDWGGSETIGTQHRFFAPSTGSTSTYYGLYANTNSLQFSDSGFSSILLELDGLNDVVRSPISTIASVASNAKNLVTYEALQDYVANNSSGSVSQPNNQIVYGSGVGISSTPDFTFNNNTKVLNINGDGSVNDSAFLEVNGSEVFEFRDGDASIRTTNDLYANSIILNGGLPTQFIKADGTLDSNSYLTDAPNDNNTYVRSNSNWVEFNQEFNPSTMLKDGKNEFTVFTSMVAKPTGNTGNGAPIVWDIVDDNDHDTSFIESLETDVATQGLKLKYPRVRRVITLSVTNDESFRKYMVSWGGTVGTSESIIYARRPAPSGFQLRGNGTNWTASGIQSFKYNLESFSNGETQLDLPANQDLYLGHDAAAVQISYTGSNNYHIRRKYTGIGFASALISFFLVDNATGLDITTPPTLDDYVHISNFGVGFTDVGLATWSTTNTLGNGFMDSTAYNFWAIGLFELYMKVWAVSNSSMRVKWQEFTGATTYKVFRNTTNDFNTATQIYNGSDFEYLDTGLNPNTRYYYWLLDQTDTEITRFNNKTLD